MNYSAYASYVVLGLVALFVLGYLVWPKRKLRPILLSEVMDDLEDLRWKFHPSTQAEPDAHSLSNHRWRVTRHWSPGSRLTVVRVSDGETLEIREGGVNYDQLFWAFYVAHSAWSY